MRNGNGSKSLGLFITTLTNNKKQTNKQNITNKKLNKKNQLAPGELGARAQLKK